MTKPLSETSFAEAPYDINRHPDARREFVRIPDPENDGVAYVIDMTFFMSKYGCMFGACPSQRPQKIESNGGCASGCCTEEVEFSTDTHVDNGHDFNDIKKIGALLPELDDSIFANRRLLEEGMKPVKKRGKRYFSQMVNGTCVFNNPQPEGPDDPPPGCAFHHLAAKKGISHTDTKPEVCWTVPLWAEWVERENVGEELHITAMSRAEWGGESQFPDLTDIDNEPTEKLKSDDYVGWWCVDSPDAYNTPGNDLAYRYFEAELTKLMGRPAYEVLCKIAEDFERRWPMPGEVVNGGAPTIATAESLFRKVRART